MDAFNVQTLKQLNNIQPSNIHLALVHFPVYNKNREIVTSSVTTLDVHDISRISRTFNVARLYFVTPLRTQQALVERIIQHWVTGYGAVYNPTRKEALLKSVVQPSLDHVMAEVEGICGKRPKIVVTDARKFPKSISYGNLRQELSSGDPFLLVFGTGWGLDLGIIEQADFVLDPVEGSNGYNHLPVRAAIAIILDRILGPNPESV